LEKERIKPMSWEEVIAQIGDTDRETGKALMDFYKVCLDHARPLKSNHSA
jgi:hypothetical protein